MNGRLSIVGCGIKFLQQITSESLYQIESADKIFTLVADPLSILWLYEKNKNVVILNKHYSEVKDRKHSYYAMVDEILEDVKTGKNVCVVSYGHPGVFAFPLHESIRQASRLGYEAIMYPSVSAEDCLFADLGVDPGSHGCLSYEATDFLVYNRPFSISCHLVLWQIGVIAVKEFRNQHVLWNKKGVEILSDYLLHKYSPTHTVTVYEAAIYPISKPKIIVECLSKLSECNITPLSTLYVPPIKQALPNMEMVTMLGLIK